MPNPIGNNDGHFFDRGWLNLFKIYRYKPLTMKAIVNGDFRHDLTIKLMESTSKFKFESSTRLQMSS